jgi:D-alanyl-D-alanine carboxypeptidase
MTRPRLLALAALCGAVVLAGCGSGGGKKATSSATTAAPKRTVSAECSPGEPGLTSVRPAPAGAQATALAQIVQSQYRSAGLCSAVFGVWRDGKPVSTGSIGAAMPGVPSSLGMRWRTGNVNESLETTLLLQDVDRGKVRLDEPIAKWFPRLPHAQQVTLQMLASSTSGYADFVANAKFAAQLDDNPFRQWTAAQMIGYAMAQPQVFPPGSSWAFSDTNFVLLGQILEKIGGRPLPELMRTNIYDKLGLRHTEETTSAAMSAPVMHAYTNERGPFEDATYWNISWEPGAGDMSSNIADMGVWAQALGEGTLLSPASHKLQTGPQNVGKGPLTSSFYYGMGAAIGKGWVLANPQVDGYTGVVAYYPPRKLAVVIASTMGPGGDINIAYSTAMFLKMAQLLTPGQVPALSAEPRGTKASK